MPEHVCIPIDVDLYGLTEPKITPPATDVYRPLGSLRCHFWRVVLRPQAPVVTVDLSRGREIRIGAWANRTDIGPACVHDARARDLERRLEALWDFVSVRHLTLEAEVHLADWDSELGMTRAEQARQRG